MQGRDPRFGQQAYHQAPSPHGPHAVYTPPPAAPPPAGAWGGHVGGAGMNMPRFGAMPGLGTMDRIGGLPAPLSFGLGLVAAFVALVFDVIFLKVHVPGVGGYAWYLTTALSFAGAGWASIRWTRASKTIAMAAVGVAAALYGVADVGLGLVVEDLSMAGAIVLGAQGVGIGLFTGFGGVFKAMRERE
ncbi:MAG: hypothetical protein JWP87_5184 [Labilithrix sp.]|nr:hypothetical protein [Labilithrix sp.]